jgi:hypothetical protein
MMGVASEAAFFETVHSFNQWLGATPNTEGVRLRKALNDPMGVTTKKAFDLFQPVFALKRDDFPFRVRDSIEQEVYPVFNLLRVYRNDAGHPKSISPNRDDVATHLRLFPRYLELLYALKNHCEQATIQL